MDGYISSSNTLFAEKISNEVRHAQNVNGIKKMHARMSKIHAKRQKQRQSHTKIKADPGPAIL